MHSYSTDPWTDYFSFLAWGLMRRFVVIRGYDAKLPRALFHEPSSVQIVAFISPKLGHAIGLVLNQSTPASTPESRPMTRVSSGFYFPGQDGAMTVIESSRRSTISSNTPGIRLSSHSVQSNPYTVIRTRINILCCVRLPSLLPAEENEVVPSPVWVIETRRVAL